MEVLYIAYQQIRNVHVHASHSIGHQSSYEHKNHRDLQMFFGHPHICTLVLSILHYVLTATLLAQIGSLFGAIMPALSLVVGVAIAVVLFSATFGVCSKYTQVVSQGLGGV